MQWCEKEQNDFPDREFYTGDDGALMHRSQRDGPHRARPVATHQIPYGDAVPDGPDA